jgi:hypothetical protein
MGNEIWGTLAHYEGRWVAMDHQGNVVADADTLAELLSAVGRAAPRLTFLYAAPSQAEPETVGV